MSSPVARVEPPPDQPLLVSTPPSEEGGTSNSSSRGEAVAAPLETSWRLTTPFAALRRAFSRGPSGAQRLDASDESSPASSSNSPAAEGDVEQPAEPAAAGSRSGSGEIQPKPGSPKFGRMGSREREKVCLICLEVLEEADFAAGRAITLECNCRGDLALRHKDCAIKWAQVKGDLVCELCKAPVRNLPALPPRPQPQPQLDEQLINGEYAAMVDLTPSYADLVFDCIRVTWVAMIVSILFFEMNLGAALWTGLVAGLAYSFMVRLMYRQHFAAMQRLAEQQQAAQTARAQSAAGGGGAPQPQQVQVIIAAA